MSIKLRSIPTSLVLGVSLLLACGDDDAAPNGTHDDASTHDHDDASAHDHDKPDDKSDAGTVAKPTKAPARDQDTRTFTIDESALVLDALPDPAVDTDRYTGVLDGAGYLVEVPKNWNGMLVMYAHGYAGTGAALNVRAPSVRRHLVEKGYAWAASSYSKNYYDVQAGVEDTNKLALAFERIAKDKGRTLDAPKKRYLIGHSMGGHITGAAIEKEAYATEKNKVKYDGAVPMCGVLADTELFNYFGAYQAAVVKLSGVPTPVTDFTAVSMQLKDALFTEYPTKTTDAGETLSHIVANLSGGARPMFDLGFSAKSNQDAVWSTFGGDGRVNGILAEPGIDTRGIVFQLDSDPAVSPEEKAFNADAMRVEPTPDANGLHEGELRFVPQVNGEFEIPVVTLHTLGDLYVPFKMEQRYLERARTKKSDKWLVQRAIRGTGHSEFTLAEQVSAFDAMIDWEQNGVKPEGDEVLDAKVVSKADYGCKFTNNTFGSDEAAVMTARSTAPACP
jgi:fermentation-respiration switch protein FrsA (DUF1100 family)